MFAPFRNMAKEQWVQGLNSENDSDSNPGVSFYDKLSMLCFVVMVAAVAVCASFSSDTFIFDAGIAAQGSHSSVEGFFQDISVL